VAKGPGAVIEETFRSLGLEPPRPVMIFESLLALPEVVANSDLVATLPRRIFEQSHVMDKLCVIPIQEPLPSLTMGILRRANQGLTPAANELLGWIRQVALS